MSESYSSRNKYQMSIFNTLLVASLLSGVIFIIPSIIGVGIFYLVGKHLRKLELWIALCLSVTYLFLFLDTWFSHYFVWTISLIGFSEGYARSDAPYAAIFAGAILVASILSLLENAGRLHWGIGKEIKTGPDEEILPSFEEKTRVSNRIASIPNTAFLVDPSVHSLQNHEEGPRSFPVGAAKDGSPVYLSEAEIRTHGLLFGSTGSGKALDIQTPILTSEGFVRLEQIEPGDTVLDERGNPCKVTFATGLQFDRECFKVTLTTGAVLVADAEHLWNAVTLAPRNHLSNISSSSFETQNTLSLLSALKNNHRVLLPPTPRTNLLSTANSMKHTSCSLCSTDVLSQNFTDILNNTDLSLVEVSKQVTDTAQQLGTLSASTPVSYDLVVSDIYALKLPCPTLRFLLAQNLTFRGASVLNGVESSKISEVVSWFYTCFNEIADIQPVESVTVKCIQVSSKSSLYLAGYDLIPTHNTETIKVIAGGLLDLGWSGLILDLKEDAQKGGLRDWCEEYATAHAVPYQEFRLSHPEPTQAKYWFNVLYGMGPDEARDTIIASQEFEAPYYRALNEKQLGQLITLLYSANQIDPEKYKLPSVYDIGRILSNPDIPSQMRPIVAAVVNVVDDLQKENFDALINPDKAMRDAAGGLGARLTAMYETRVGRLALRPVKGEKRASFDVTNPGISYVGLDSMGKPEITRLASASVLRRMAVYAADRTSGQAPASSPRFLIVDEANFVSRRLLLELLSRARSAGIACVVCTQGPSDWDSSNRDEPGLESLVQNTNVSIIMSQGERYNAEICANIIGQGERTVVNHRITDSLIGASTKDGSTVSSAIDYLVGPDALRSLEIGEAVIRVGKPHEWRKWVKVVQRDPSAMPAFKAPRKQLPSLYGH